AHEKDIGVVVRSVLLKGVLTPRYASLPAELAELREAARRLETLVRDECESLAEAAFRYVLANPHISTALVGTGKLRNLERAVEYAGRGPLSPSLAAELRCITVADESLLDPSTWERR
ncbi:MAG: aldo/keto reductase, partial [Anaerolineae bacterium]